MSRPSISVECPSCETPVSATLVPADGGPVAADELHGKEVRCRECETELELLFYPSGGRD